MIQEYYNLLGLRNIATKEEIDNRYEELCIEYYSNPQKFTEERFNKITEAYYIIKGYTTNKNRIREEQRFALKKTPITGKLNEVIRLHGLKMLTVSSAALIVFVAAERLKNLYDNGNSLSNIFPSYSIEMDIESDKKIIKNTNRGLEPASIDSAISDTDINLEKTETGHTIKNIDGVTYVDGFLIVNKTYSLPDTYVPTDTSSPVTKESGVDCLTVKTLEAFNNMNKDAKQEGLKLWIASGYRSYSYQDKLYNKYVSQDSVESVDTYSARPGHSEHQTGLAFDLNTVTQSFANTKEGKWINENCYKYGFIIRYPKDKLAETGYVYEPWHLRYVGVELATKLYNDGSWTTLEDYFGITSVYNYEIDEVRNKTM